LFLVSEPPLILISLMKQNDRQSEPLLTKESVGMKQSNHQSGKYLNKESILADFRMANLSRDLSVIGRREVLTGKAKFGIFGDGKEIIQLAMAKQFRNGDWRSGYYRDQTWMMAMGLYDSLEFFHQLY